MKFEITIKSIQVKDGFFFEPLLTKPLNTYHFEGNLDEVLEERQTLSAACPVPHVARIRCLGPRKPAGFDKRVRPLFHAKEL